MPWRDAYGLHIFAPSGQSHENWVEQILGSVIRPAYQEFGEQIQWMWVTRYIEPLEFARRDAIGEYCQKNPIPSNYVTHHNGTPYCRYAVFRLSVDSVSKSQIQQECLALAEKAGFWVVPWTKYDMVADLGSDRFIYPGAADLEREGRAFLVARFVDATVRLMLHSLVEEGGQWKLELNTSDQNPAGSIFQSIHHLYCNTTGVPIDVLVDAQTRNGKPRRNSILVATDWMFAPLEISVDNLPARVRLQF